MKLAELDISWEILTNHGLMLSAINNKDLVLIFSHADDYSFSIENWNDPNFSTLSSYDSRFIIPSDSLLYSLFAKTDGLVITADGSEYGYERELAFSKVDSGLEIRIKSNGKQNSTEPWIVEIYGSGGGSKVSVEQKEILAQLSRDLYEFVKKNNKNNLKER